MPLSQVDETFVRANISAFENFWNRHVGEPLYQFGCGAYGYDVQLTTNDTSILRAAKRASLRYARSDSLYPRPAIRLGVYVARASPDQPVPENLPALIQTFGVGDYLMQAFTPHLQGFGDMRNRHAFAMLSPALANDPSLVSRYILDRLVLNIVLREPLGQLHATCLVKDQRAVLLTAPHGTGKSTTAFHLLRAAWRLMGDSLVFIRRAGKRFELLGYPVGEGKLVRDMAGRFPELETGGVEVTVHDAAKDLFDLRALLPDKITAHSIFPGRVDLVLAERDASGVTRVERLDAEDAFRRVLPDTIYVDEFDAMVHSLDIVRALVGSAKCWRLNLGRDTDEIVSTIERL